MKGSRGDSSPAASKPMTTIDKEQLTELARLVADTARQEIDCEVFLERAAAYLETYRIGEPLPLELEAAEQHLKICPECYEELQLLKRAVEI